MIRLCLNFNKKRKTNNTLRQLDKILVTFILDKCNQDNDSYDLIISLKVSMRQ